MTIDQTIARIKKMKAQVVPIAIDVFESKSTKIGDLNRDQLSKGKTAFGTDMPSYVSNSKAPKAPGTIKLYDKGGYTKGIVPKYLSAGIDMTSTDKKVSFLDSKYPSALGLNDESINESQKEVIPEIQKRLLKL